MPARHSNPTTTMSQTQQTRTEQTTRAQQPCDDDDADEGILAAAAQENAQLAKASQEILKKALQGLDAGAFLQANKQKSAQ